MRYLISRIRFANSGIIAFFRNERNGKTQGVIAVIVIIAAFALQISYTQCCILLLCIAVVIGLEMMNTAIEQICNIISPNYDDRIKYIKDVSAAAVWIASLISLIIGVIIFYQPLTKLF